MFTNQNSRISQKHKQEFDEQGFILLKRVISEPHLEILRSECDRLLEETNKELDREKTQTCGLTNRDRSYFFTAYERSNKLHEFIFSDLIEEVCRALLGDTAYLFYETYIVKCPKMGLPLGWHQDSGYINRKHKPFITFWCTLDEVNEENGTLRVLPYPRAGTKVKKEHVLLSPNSPERKGYFGDEPGDPIILPPGSIAVLSSTLFHYSGPNTSDNIRRAYLIDFASEIILSDSEDTKLRGMAEPFLIDGIRVA